MGPYNNVLIGVLRTPIRCVIVTKGPGGPLVMLIVKGLGALNKRTAPLQIILFIGGSAPKPPVYKGPQGPYRCMI